MTPRIAIFAGAAGLLASFAGAAPASAAPPARDHFEESGSEVIEDFCGDLTVREDFHVEGSGVFVATGSEGLFHFTGTQRGTVSWTNLANGRTFTQIWTLLNKDLHVVDNGDGTLTLVVLETGGTRILVDGELLFRNTGQVRYAILLDHAGTPSDPSDDVFLEFLGEIFGPTGRNDTLDRDFCEDIHTFIG